MDLRSIINNEAGESSRQKQAVPVTPVQAPPQQSFRDYGRPLQSSPGSHPSKDYGADIRKTRGSYPSPTPSQDQRVFSNRPPPPPPLQAPSQNDLRSPAGSFSAQSPYRQSVSTLMSNQYPFPQHQIPQSPGQHHQYPPNFQPRDSHSQPTPAPPHLQTNISQNQTPSTPQTPPIGMPGAPHPYLQQQQPQRSQSSNSTPTSAHSQATYFSQYPQESPVSATTSQFPPAQIPTHQRQQSQHSQPGTPIATPITQRPPSGGFVQPTSPYQQRGVPTGPFSQFRTSPAPPSSSTPQLPSTPGGFDPQRNSASDQQRRSQSERERSMSVSPKTRPPGQATDNNVARPPQLEQDTTNAAKRKMEDREAPVEHPQRLGQPDIKAQINGNRRTPSGSTSSPKQPPRKRIRYLEPPIWAQSVIGRSKSILGVAKVNNKANGAQPVTIPIQAAPPPAKVDINGHNQGPPMAGQVEDPSRILGPWEKSITGKKPFEDMTKIVADWLYVNVVSRNDLGELASHGVDVEIEAKIGQLIDKDTSQRYTLPVLSECILRENPRIGFKSSMTETQHRSLNDFLNQHVAQAHPQNPQNPGAQRRVPIDYLHRRETDKFFELPPSHHASLPPAVRERLNARHPVKVRVTYAQDPKEPKAILAKIIKARIADIDIYNPQSPLDCRISINFEMRYDGDVEELKAMSIDNRIPDRNKDRLSYKQSHYQVDLTQVTQITSANGVNRMDKEHELEIEISTAAIKEQGRRAAAGEANEYVSLVEGFLDNMRVLARAVPPT